MKLILFDIDGTILWTDGAGRRAIRRALLEELGTAGPIDAYRLDGKTDPQIVRELLELAGHPAASDERAIAAACDRYVALLTRDAATPARRARRTCSRRSPTRRRCWTRSSSERRARRAGSEGAGGRSRGGGARGDGGGSRPRVPRSDDRPALRPRRHARSPRRGAAPADL